MVWLALSLIAGAVASNKGRSGFGFFLLSVLLTPLVGLIAALVAQPSERIEMDLARRGRSSEFKKCPKCAEVIRNEALRCRFCGEELTLDPGPPKPVYAPTSAAPALNMLARSVGRKIGAIKRASDANHEPTLAEILARETPEERP